jgi:hypothetical protein
MNVSTNINLKESDNLFKFDTTIPRNCCARYCSYFYHLGRLLFGTGYNKDTLVSNRLMRESKRLMSQQYNQMLSDKYSSSLSGAGGVAAGNDLSQNVVLPFKPEDSRRKYKETAENGKAATNASEPKNQYLEGIQH